MLVNSFGQRLSQLELAPQMSARRLPRQAIDAEVRLADGPDAFPTEQVGSGALSGAYDLHDFGHPRLDICQK